MDSAHADLRQDAVPKGLNLSDRVNKALSVLFSSTITNESERLRQALEEVSSLEDMARIYMGEDKRDDTILYHNGIPVRFDEDGQMLLIERGGCFAMMAFPPLTLILNALRGVDYAEQIAELISQNERHYNCFRISDPREYNDGLVSFAVHFSNYLEDQEIDPSSVYVFNPEDHSRTPYLPSSE